MTRNVRGEERLLCTVTTSMRIVRHALIQPERVHGYSRYLRTSLESIIDRGVSSAPQFTPLSKICIRSVTHVVPTSAALLFREHVALR